MIIQKFMKGVFAMRLALPRYGITWDAAMVLKYLKSQSPPEALTLLALSWKLAMLMVLLTGQRGQAIHSLDVKSIEMSGNSMILSFNKLLKTSRPGKHCAEIVLPAFTSDVNICIVHTFKAYLA